MIKRLLLGAALATMIQPAVAKPKGDGGVPLEIRVIDSASMSPIATAKIRNPQEKEAHAVNAVTGAWKGDVLYMPDGTELFFAKGMTLEFEVSAPGYTTEKLTHVMRGRKNVVQVGLTEMKLDLLDLEEDDPVIQFGRDKPIGGKDIK